MISARALVYMNPGMPVFEEIGSMGPGEGSVGIEVIASSLCNTSELRSFKGGYSSGYGVEYPMKPGEPGHEAVGRISSLGENTGGFSIGDIVVMTGHGGEPCHRSYVSRKTKDIAVIRPGDRDVREAAVLEMYGCAYHCAMTPLEADDYKGKRVLVMGLGAMGLCTVQILKNHDVAEITAVDLSEERLEMAIASGADRAVRPDGAKGRYDIVIECSGSVPGQEMACSLAPEVLIFSSYNTKGITIRQNLWFDAQTTIYNPGIVTSENFIKVADLYNDGLIDPSLLVQKIIRPAEVEYLGTIEEIKSGKIVKAVMEW